MFGTLSYKHQKSLLIFFFLLIPVTLLCLFGLYPATFLIYLSFTSWNGLSPDKVWIGLENFKEVMRNEEIWSAFSHNFIYLLWGLLQNAIGLIFALILNSRLRGRNIYRVILFMPFIMNGVAVAYMFNYMFNTEYGSLNTLLHIAGLDSLAISWFGSPKVVNHVLGFIGLWKYMGFNMVLYLAALQSVSSEMLEAARIDGARYWQTVFRIIVPNITKIIELNLFLTVIGALEAFELPFLLTKGGPLGASDTFVLNAMNTAFDYSNFGLASAMSVTLIVMVVVVLAVQRTIFRRWDP